MASRKYATLALFRAAQFGITFVAKNYLQLTPVSGKWYVSERVQSALKAWHPSNATEQQPERSPAMMIVAGPFETRNDAKEWDKLTSASGYIWEKG